MKHLIQHGCEMAQELLELTHQRHLEYATRHGYEFYADTERRGNWSMQFEKFRVLRELLALRKLLPGDLIAVLDADCLITAEDDLADALPDSTELAMRVKPPGADVKYASGVIVARVTPAVILLIERMDALGPIPEHFKNGRNEGRFQLLVDDDKSLRVAALDPKWDRWVWSELVLRAIPPGILHIACPVYQKKTLLEKALKIVSERETPGCC